MPKLSYYKKTMMTICIEITCCSIVAFRFHSSHKHYLLQTNVHIPLDSDVRYSTIHVSDLFEEEDKCLGQYTTHSSAPQFFIHRKFDSFANFYCRDPPSD